MSSIALKIYFPKNNRVLVTLFHDDQMKQTDIFMNQVIRKRVKMMRVNFELLGGEIEHIE